MTPVEIGIGGLLLSLILILIRVQIGITLGLVAIIGITLIADTKAALGTLTVIPINFIADWNLSAVPMFLLMGYVAAQAGLTAGLFKSARILLAQIPGGLASSTVLASALFASASGSSVATSATFARIAVPEMLDAGYKPSLATGSVAAAGTLGSLIPPSILLILFGIFTSTSIGSLFVAGIVPGLLSAIAFIAMITLRCRLNPSLAPTHEAVHSSEETISALKDIWPLPVIIVCVLGGIFSGIFSPTEAGSVGAAMAIIIAVLRKSFNKAVFKAALIETAEGTSSIFFIAIGASLFTVFMALSSLPTALSEWLLIYINSPILIIIGIALIYILLGIFVDSMSILLLTLPVLLPILKDLDINMIWFGIITIKLLEIGMITPPVGLNVYIIKSALGDRIELVDIFKGALWFIVTDLVTLGLLIAFPALTLFLPSIM